jgi:tetraacyldisaccharide 4'-kinase
MPTAPDFWWLKHPNWQARVLQPFGMIYGAITAQRMAREGHYAGIPIMCVGNFVAGGAGKTPVAIALANLFKENNLKPFFLTRGYGARTHDQPHIVTEEDEYADVGDEALLLARHAPVIISRNRISGAYMAAEQGADVVIMDDGLQNPSLKKTRSLAVVDAVTGVGNGLCVPAGPLRAPLDDQWRLISSMILVGEGEAGTLLAQEARQRHIPVFNSRLEPPQGTIDYIRQRPVLAFAGIGRPAKFFNMLSAHGVQIMEHFAFPDHHAYSKKDIALMMRRARINGVTHIVTTEKDFVRIPKAWREDDFASILAVPVHIRFEKPELITSFFNLA